MSVTIQLAGGKRAEVRLCRWHSADESLASALNLMLGREPTDAVLVQAQRHAPDQDWLRALRAVELFEGARILRGHAVPPAPEGAVDG